MKEAGLDDLIRTSIALYMKDEKNIALSLIFAGANFSLYHAYGLKYDAYNVAMEIYLQGNNDAVAARDEVIALYKDKAREKMEGICEKVPDGILAQHSADLDSTFVIKMKTVNNIKKALNQKLENCLVFSMEDNYNLYLNKYKKHELKEAAKEAAEEVKEEGELT